MKLAEWRHRLKLLQSALDNIQKSIESIDKNTKPHSGPANSQPANPQAIIVDRFNLPVEATRYYESQQRQESPKIWRILKPWVEFGSFAALVAYVIVTADTFREIKRQTPNIEKSAGVAVKSLEVTNRAYLAIGSPQLAATGVEIAIPIENHGHVAATNLAGILEYITTIGTDTSSITHRKRSFSDPKAIILPGLSSAYALIIDIPAFTRGQNASILGSVDYDTGFGRDSFLVCIVRNPKGEWSTKEFCGRGVPEKIDLTH
jgi:hypothetical protein